MEITKTIKLNPDSYTPICAVANPEAPTDWYEYVSIDAITFSNNTYEVYKVMFASVRSGGSASTWGKVLEGESVSFGYKTNANSITGLREIVLYVKGTGHMQITIHATDGVIKPILDEKETNSANVFSR